MFPILEYTSHISLARDSEYLNNNHKADSASNGSSSFGREADAVIDSLKSDTQDVLDCNDYTKVINDCAEDCINLITDYLHSSLANSDDQNNIRQPVNFHLLFVIVI